MTDDCALNASSKGELQRNMDKVSFPCDAFGLISSTKNAGVMFQPAPYTNNSEPTVQVKGQKLQTVDKFTYLDSPVQNG